MTLYQSLHIAILMGSLVVAIVAAIMQNKKK